MRIRPSELSLFRGLLEQDWVDVDDLAEALIKALDEDRAKRTDYIAVAQFGSKATRCWYIALGPYSGKASATSAARSHPGFSLATAIVVIPMTSSLGVERLLKEVG